MIWFRVNDYRSSRADWIEPVEVQSNTARFVTLASGRRWSRDNIFPTWQEAHDELVGRKARAFEVAQGRLDYALSRLAEVNALEPPK